MSAAYLDPNDERKKGDPNIESGLEPQPGDSGQFTTTPPPPEGSNPVYDFGFAGQAKGDAPKDDGKPEEPQDDGKPEEPKGDPGGAQAYSRKLYDNLAQRNYGSFTGDWGFESVYDDWASKYGMTRPDYSTTALAPTNADYFQRGGDFTKQLQAYTANFLSNPSRYDADLVKQGMGVIDAEMARLRRNRTMAAEADLTRRGIASSGLGQQYMEETQRNLQQEQDQRLFDLMREQALTYSQDRTAAYNAGSDLARFGESQYQFDRDEGLRSRQLDLQRYGIDMDAFSSAGRTAADVRAGDANRALTAKKYGWDAFSQDRDFQYGRDRDERDFGFRQDELDWRASEAEKDREISRRANELREKGLDADEAWRQAEQEWRKQEADRNQRNIDEDREWRQKEAERDRIWQLLREWGFEGMDPKLIKELLAQMGLDPNLYDPKDKRSNSGPTGPGPNNNRPRGDENTPGDDDDDETRIDW